MGFEGERGRGNGGEGGKIKERKRMKKKVGGERRMGRRWGRETWNEGVESRREEMERREVGRERDKDKGMRKGQGK